MSARLKYTKVRADAILQSLRMGNPRMAAASAAGVTARTLQRWIHEHPDLAERIEIAEAEAIRAHMANINRAATRGNWTASAWVLERRHPTEFGRVDRVEVYRVQEQARTLAEELRAEGIEVSAAELLRERELLAQRTQKALPPGSTRKAS